MAVDYTRLTIKDVILHQVARPPGDKGKAVATYSEAPLEWDTLDRGFLQSKLRAALASARPVIELKEDAGPTPDLLRAYFGGTGDLLAASRVITDLVVDHQAWNSSNGLLMVVEGELPKAEACLVITKLEHEQGMQIEQTTNAAGLATYKAQVLRNIILGQGTKVFKVGAFPASAAGKGRLKGVVVDAQNLGVADYFRVQVLGCDFTERDDVLTQRFFETAQRWIARQKDPEVKARYEMALLSEMQSSKRRLSAAQFAQDHIDENEADGFVADLISAGVPQRDFGKDVQHIRGSIRRVKVQTRRGASLYVPPDMYEDGSFQVTKGDEGQSTLSLHDEVTRMTGASGPKSASSDD
jgi:hypothetical protein